MSDRLRPESLIGIAGLRKWANEVEKRRGKRVAVLALARKIAGILYALWRDGGTYVPERGPRSLSPMEEALTGHQPRPARIHSRYTTHQIAINSATSDSCPKMQVARTAMR